MKIIQKTFTFCLKPTSIQKKLFAQYAGCSRFVYNYALNLIKTALEEGKPIPSYEDIANRLPYLKVESGTEFLKEPHSQILQQSIKDLIKAIKLFFSQKKKKRKFGFPKFKRRGMGDSFKFPQNITCSNGKVHLPKIGSVSYYDSRPIEGVIKQAVVKRHGSRWFVHIVCNIILDVPSKRLDLNKAVGIDVGLSKFATLSNGQVIENPKFLTCDIERLRFLSRAHSRKQKGSKNRRKSAAKLGKQHLKIANKRKDFVEKASTNIVKNHDYIIVENLNISGMLIDRRLSRAISDAGWRLFLRKLKYKAEWQDKVCHEIDRFEPTSKVCSDCKDVKDMPLAIRRYICEKCGLNLDRDLNAAINIRAAKKSLWLELLFV